MKFVSFIIGILLVGLFSFAAINFGLQMAVENNASVSLADDPFINQTYGDLSVGLNDSQRDISGTQQSFENNTQISSGGEDLNILSIPSILISITSAIRVIYNSTIGLIGNVLGIPNIVLNIILAILVFIGILAAWRVIKVGE